MCRPRAVYSVRLQNTKGLCSQRHVTRVTIRVTRWFIRPSDKMLSDKTLNLFVLTFLRILTMCFKTILRF